MNKNIKATILLVLNSITVSFFGVFTRLLLPYLGGFYQIAIIFGLVAIILSPKFISTKNIRLEKFLDLRFATLILSFPLYVIFFTISISEIPVANAFFYNFSGSLISAILISKYFFNEEINTKKISVLLLLLIGLFIYAYPLNFHYVWGIICGLLAGIFTAISNGTRKYYSTKTDKWSIIFLQMFVGSMLSILLALLTTDLWDFSFEIFPIIIITLYVIGNILVPYLLTIGFQNIKMNIGSIILSSQLIFILIWAELFFKETPTKTELLGVTIIFIAILISNLISFKK